MAAVNIELTKNQQEIVSQLAKKAGKTPEQFLAALIDSSTNERNATSAGTRTPGRFEGQIRIADDFDELPDDLAEAFGMKDP